MKNILQEIYFEKLWHLHLECMNGWAKSYHQPITSFVKSGHLRFISQFFAGSTFVKHFQFTGSHLFVTLVSSFVCMLMRVNKSTCHSPLWKRVMAWVESNCPSDCGIVWGDDGYCYRPPKQSHNRLGSYSRPRPSLFFKVGYWRSSWSISG